ncbi:putative lipoprotein LppJ [Mycolicibacterium anyangense]|uniref:Putative lipoprotein LppJ n=1 Tax=Mycolicibacterium anyangense TaxID=1431246 RepID=A0A6N4W7T3_9MYCO|nr:hypothetical protein [Mycolicibacterium anyangense]BBZ76102.1 putative lipoprotein LppJ [Mycolicibacterium anyangense]
MSTSSTLRSGPAILLIAAALGMSLVLGISYLVLHTFRESRGAAVEPVAHPMTDVQSKAQVLGPARDIVSAGRLSGASGTYLLMSCQNADDPPYQGAIYLNFDVPGVMGTPKFFAAIAAAMRAEGWQEALPPNRHPGGRALTREGVTIIYFRNDDTSTRGTMQIYGECRNVTDHRLDTTGWVDITPELRP